MAGKRELLNASASGTAFTNLVLTDFGSVGSTIYEKDKILGHDWFLSGTSMTIFTETGGGGTQLTEDTDYVLSVANTELGSYAGKTVYSTIQIINATYQTGDIYLNGTWIADSIKVSDINELRPDIKTKAVSYTITDDYQEQVYLVTPTSADVTITLSTLADNFEQVYHIKNLGAGTGNTIIDGEGSETIDGATDYTIIEQYDKISIIAAADEWKILTKNNVPAGVIEMYAGIIAPIGYLLCNGTAISRTKYVKLYSVLNTTYGSGDSSTTFNVPDFRGIFPRGAGTSGTLTDSASDAFAAVLGTYQNDQMQQITGNASPVVVQSTIAGSACFSVSEVDDGIFDTGTSGDGTTLLFDSADSPNARTGAETNPANLAVSFIIKY